MSKIRVKFRQMPGDISKKAKIAMLEGKAPLKMLVYEITAKAAKLWKKHRVRARERAVGKERARIEVERQMND